MHNALTLQAQQPAASNDIDQSTLAAQVVAFNGLTNQVFSLKYINDGKYDGTHQQQITNTILGENAATIAWIVPSDPDKKRKHDFD